MKTLGLIQLILMTVIVLSCSEVEPKNEIKDTENITVETTESTMKAISLGTSEELIQKIKEIHNSGGLDSLIAWSNNTMTLNNQYQITKDKINSKDRTFTFKGIRIYKLDSQGNDLNKVLYESAQINPDSTDPCFTYRENFKADYNYSFVIYESVQP